MGEEISHTADSFPRDLSGGFQTIILRQFSGDLSDLKQIHADRIYVRYVTEKGFVIISESINKRDYPFTVH